MATSKSRSSKTDSARLARAEAVREERKQRRQTASVTLFAFSVFLFALALIKGQSLWLFMHTALFGLFGIFAYGIGPIVFFLALLIAYNRSLGGVKITSALLLIVTVCGAFLIFGGVAVPTGPFFSKIADFYVRGTQMSGGGLTSAIIGWPLLELFGRPGADITAVLLVFVFFMTLTGKSLIDLIEGVRDPVKARRKRINDRRELLNELDVDDSPVKPQKGPGLFVRRRSRIDIPLEPRGKGIDIPLGPPARPYDGSAPGGQKGIKERGSEKVGAGAVPTPEEEQNSQNSSDSQVILSIFEEAQRERRREREIFAKFPPPEKSEELDFETERLIKRAADNYDRGAEPGAKGKPARKKTSYSAPSYSFLERDARQSEENMTAELRANADFLVKTLESFGVKTKVVDIARGPTVTRYELQPSTGVRLSRITNLADDLALNLATAGVRIEAPIPNKAAVGIEVPNKQKRLVRLRPIVESEEFKSSASPLTVALGRDISGKIMTADIAKMPHLLIAGTTGSGKSRCLHSMILSMIFKSPPEELRFVFIDPKMVEFGIYNGVPHMLIPVVTDARKAAGALGWAVGEMMSRYRKFSEYGVRDITSFNRAVESGVLSFDPGDEESEPPEMMHRIVIIIDELADLMMVSPREVEDSICRLAQMARAAGLHLIIATQRPSVDVITGIIKANISSRIALSVSSQIDSRTIIDSAGAEKLIGNGDMLFLPLDLPKPVRIQGCFVSDEEIDRVIRELKKNAVIDYNEQVLEEIERQAPKGKGSDSSDSGDDADSMLDDAISTVVETGQASTSFLQRRLKLGYARAARIMDEMEQMGVIGPSEGSKPRAVNMTVQQWHEMRLRRDQAK